MPADQEYLNQSHRFVEKIGFTRVRAMELLRILLSTLDKIKQGPQMLSKLLRTKIRDTMMYMLLRYPFCGISN
jgi:hypothetical protein